MSPARSWEPLSSQHASDREQRRQRSRTQRQLDPADVARTSSRRPAKCQVAGTSAEARGYYALSRRGTVERSGPRRETPQADITGSSRSVCRSFSMGEFASPATGTSNITAGAGYRIAKIGDTKIDDQSRQTRSSRRIDARASAGACQRVVPHAAALSTCLHRHRRASFGSARRGFVSVRRHTPRPCLDVPPRARPRAVRFPPTVRGLAPLGAPRRRRAPACARGTAVHWARSNCDPPARRPPSPW